MEAGRKVVRGWLAWTLSIVPALVVNAGWLVVGRGELFAGLALTLGRTGLLVAYGILHVAITGLAPRRWAAFLAHLAGLATGIAYAALVIIPSETCPPETFCEGPGAGLAIFGIILFGAAGLAGNAAGLIAAYIADDVRKERRLRAKDRAELGRP